MGLIRFIQAHNTNKELKAMRTLKEKEFGTSKHSHALENCQICGRPKGFQQFYLVTRENKSLNVCERCADEIDNEDKLKNEISTKITEQTSQDEAIKIIKLRYAKGEITKEQYGQMKEDLEK